MGVGLDRARSAAGSRRQAFTGRLGPRPQGQARRNGVLLGRLDRRADDGQVPHLAAGAGPVLAVEVQAQAGLGQRRLPVGRPGLPEVAEQVGHGRRRHETFGRAQRQAADRPQLLLELAAAVGVDRQVALQIAENPRARSAKLRVAERTAAALEWLDEEPEQPWY